MTTFFALCFWSICNIAALNALQQREFSLSASPYDMKMDSGGRIFLAAGNQLFRLDDNLTVEENIGLDTLENITLGSSVLRVALSSDERRLAVCWTDALRRNLTCGVFNASNFNAGPERRVRMFSATTSEVSVLDMMTLFAAHHSGDDYGFYVAFYEDQAGIICAGQTVDYICDQSHITQFGSVGGTSFIRRGKYVNYRQILTHNLTRAYFSQSLFSDYHEPFVGGFVEGNYTYWFATAVVNFHAPWRYIVMMRACHRNDGCGANTARCQFQAFYKMELPCDNSMLFDYAFNSLTTVCGVSLLKQFTDSEPTLVLSLCGQVNIICKYNFTELNKYMDAWYEYCDKNVTLGDSFPLSLEPPLPVYRYCYSFAPLGVCDFKQNAIIEGRYSFGIATDFQGYDIKITTSLAIRAESVALIFVGYERNESQYIIETLHVAANTRNFGAKYNVTALQKEIPSAARQLQWRDGFYTVYVATDSGVLQIPLEECANFTDCESCISYNHPLCGWCTVEDKCSRRSQCQNAVEPVRWVQESSQCISTTVMPRQFVPDNPEILSVTATPGLPPLLINESYQCQFADREGRIITVDAEEVTPNTTYQCNITGRTPSFTGALTVMDISFVSSDVGIPFATNVGALNVIRCESLESCSQCLQTQNLCGWCIYDKVCSGTPTPCTNKTNWLQLNRTNTTYVDVCPLLEPSSFTPTGDYVQPVGVDRDIHLQTKNLPAPISGFSYICRLRGSVDLPAIYNNDSMITCIVNRTQILFSSFIGREDITVSIVWVIASSGRQHLIDIHIPVRMVLYNCPLLAEGCSSCLGVNLATGFECGWCNGDSDDMCYVSVNCHSPAHFATSSAECPTAKITSVFPASGPLQGGTTVNITGTDMGVTLDNVESITIGSSPCIIHENGYIPGVQIICVTTSFTSGPGFKNVTIFLQRGARSVKVVGASLFTVVAPTVMGVEPAFGPRSGGTAITIRGTGLNISNTNNLRVTLTGGSGPNCIIQNIAETEISCTSTPYTGNTSSLPSMGSVVVHIDNAKVTGNGVEFTYRSDPNFTAVTPRMTIPAGGINLTFIGTDLNSVQRPTLVVNDHSASPQETVCHPKSAASLVCTAPALRGGDLMDSSINYTIIMDNAPAPSNGGDLRLSLVPDPNIVTNGTNALVIKDFTPGVRSPIRIHGVNLDSVNDSEIEVLVGGEVCSILHVSQYRIICFPPEQAPGGVFEATVMVLIGENLNFTAGTLSYTPSTNMTAPSVSATATAFAVVLPILAIIAVLITVGIFVFLCWKKQNKSTVEEIQLSGISTLTRGTSDFQVTDEFIAQVPQHLIIPSSHFQLHETIGQGEFGVVYRAILLKKQGMNRPGFVAAVKTMRGFFTPRDVQSMMDEVLKMQSFDHPNVMNLIGVCLDAGPGLALVMPYMVNGSLLAYIKQERPNLDLNDDAEINAVLSVRKLLLRMCHQITLGMEYLAERKFVHRDLAARNCMLDRYGNVKVSDFGLTEDVYTRGYFKLSEKNNRNVSLPYKWIPPESFQDGVFSEKSDVWAFGVTCWEVFTTGKIPYPATDPTSLLTMLKSGQRLEKPSNAACTLEMHAIMEKCWKMNPAERPAFSELTTILKGNLQFVSDYTEFNMILPANEVDPEYEQVDSADIEEGEPLSDDSSVERKSMYDASDINGDGNAVCKSQTCNPLYQDLQPGTSTLSPTATEEDGQPNDDRK